MKALIVLCAMILVEAILTEPKLLTENEETSDGVVTQGQPIYTNLETAPTRQAKLQNEASAMWAELLKEISDEAKAQVTVPFSARSLNSNIRLKVTFTNNRSTPIKIYWVRDSDNVKQYNTLAPNTQYTQLTYGTHPWIVTDQNDDVLHFFIPYRTDAEITIEQSASAW